jgi:hypothetical protein
VTSPIDEAAATVGSMLVGSSVMPSVTLVLPPRCASTGSGRAAPAVAARAERLNERRFMRGQLL